MLDLAKTVFTLRCCETVVNCCGLTSVRPTGEYPFMSPGGLIFDSGSFHHLVASNLRIHR